MVRVEGREGHYTSFPFLPNDDSPGLEGRRGSQTQFTLGLVEVACCGGEAWLLQQTFARIIQLFQGVFHKDPHSNFTLS